MQLSVRSTALLACVMLVIAVATAAEPSTEQRRTDARKMAAETLARL